MRVAVYTDYVYREVDGGIYAERAFALFLSALASHVSELILIGRLAPEGEAHYRLPDAITLRPVAFYSSLASPVQALAALVRSMPAMWRALDAVDVVWILGPYPHALLLVLLAKSRRRRIVLGVRQDWPRYVRARRPNRRLLHLAADLLEATWRRLARRLPVVAVGHELSLAYQHAPAVLDLTISLVPAADVLSDVPERDYDGELRILSVGRLEQEKNPLLLADVLAELPHDGRRWRLLVCGEGDLAEPLRERLRLLGVEDHAELLGYVPMGPRLTDLYRKSHALLHVSWTEGFPQILIEAFAAGLPVVATAVGGVAAGARDACLLIAPGDATAAVAALEQIAADPALRQSLGKAALRNAQSLTLETQIARLATFLRDQAGQPLPAARASDG